MGFRLNHVWLLVAVYCLLGTGVFAKKNKSTPAPTAPPTKKPKNDKPQEPPPTPAPPTDPPPTAPPPTEQPTPSPTVLPTPSPTQVENDDFGTRAPSFPTTAPSVSPTDTLFDVQMATMSLNMTTTGEVNSYVLQTDMEEILTLDVFDRAFDNFSHVDLDVAIFSDMRRTTTFRDRADINGVARFKKEPTPTTEELTDFLKTYFSVFGSDDLTTRLSTNNPSILQASMDIDGETVGAPDDDKNIDTGVVPGGATTGQNTPTNTEDTVGPGLIGGLVAGCVVLCIAVGLLVWQQRQGRALRAEKGHMSPSPDRTATETPDTRNMVTVPVEDFSVSALSYEDSIYTSNSELKQKMGAKYSARRLDKLIQSAQKFSLRSHSSKSSKSGDSEPRDSSIPDIQPVLSPSLSDISTPVVQTVLSTDTPVWAKDSESLNDAQSVASSTPPWAVEPSEADSVSVPAGEATREDSSTAAPETKNQETSTVVSELTEQDASALPKPTKDADSKEPSIVDNDDSTSFTGVV